MAVSASPRKGIESVLLATDFSEGAARAIRRAVRLPLAPGARIALLHILLAGRSAEILALAEQQSRRILEQMVPTTAEAARAAGHRDVGVTAESVVGQPFVEIIRRARAADAELIVMGRHGEGGRPTFGSTAKRVIRKGDTPVLVVHREPTRPYRRVLAAVDLSDTSPRVLELARRLAGAEARAVTVVHAYHVPFEGVIPGREYREAIERDAMTAYRQLMEPLGETKAGGRFSLEPGDPRLVILGEARRQRAELITLGTHGRGGLSHVLLGSVAEWVLERASCDVAVTRPARFSFELP